jgi:UDP-GlcNAc:undecaprenyl-phosphate GlcNAc-1-phosphate transferase
MPNPRKFVVKLKNRLTKLYAGFLHSIKNKLVSFTLLNSLLILAEVLYIRLRFVYINEQIPFWFSKLWGSYQLAPKRYIYMFPIVSLCLTIIGLLLLILLSKFFVRYLHSVVSIGVLFTNLLLGFSAVRIIFLASNPFPPFLGPRYLSLFWPWLTGFFATFLFLPKFIELAYRYKIVTNPGVHAHPAMILRGPSARGGGIFYALMFILLSLLFVGFQTKYLGFYLALIMLSVLALVDDFQNTHTESDFRILESPFLRLTLLFSVVSLIAISGITFNTVGTMPIDFGFLNTLVPIGVTSVWIVWVLNVLSWSNGIDGQYCGIVGISSLIVAVLALRFVELDALHTQVAVMAALSSGIAFGFTKLTWHPSKIMWGFGAMSAGLVLSVLSVLVNTKIVTSMLIVLIPFIDALVTVVRRIIQRKNPLKGDRGHLHHILMERGWSIGKIALFYWVTTIIFGIIGVLSSEMYTLQIAFFLAGIVAFFIVLLNVKFYNHK